jgi:hypothetical protein
MNSKKTRTVPGRRGADRRDEAECRSARSSPGGAARLRGHGRSGTLMRSCPDAGRTRAGGCAGVEHGRLRASGPPAERGSGELAPQTSGNWLSKAEYRGRASKARFRPGAVSETAAFNRSATPPGQPPQGSGSTAAPMRSLCFGSRRAGVACSHDGIGFQDAEQRDPLRASCYGAGSRSGAPRWRTTGPESVMTPFLQMAGPHRRTLDGLHRVINAMEV